MQKSETIVRYTDSELDEMLARGEDRSDLDRVRALTEDELEASIDLAEEGEVDWSSLQVGLPEPKRQLTLRLDADVVDWFKSRGPGYQTRMNAVLRSYVDSQRRSA